VNRQEQKLENALLYVDFLNNELPIILMKDGSLLVLFQLLGLDYEGLAEDVKEQFSHFARSAMEQLPEEGAGFMLSNLLIRDTPHPLPLKKNPSAPPLIQFVQSKKQDFWDDLISKSFGNRILCALRYFPPKKKDPNWGMLI
jgi:type IV secretory pathway VirB4 component